MGLPTISLAELEQHNSSKSCYVTIGSKVYDVTSFLSDHPGGEDLIIELVNHFPLFVLFTFGAIY
jgi:4-hydroxysphinganine ceramide fatty acyl 2-hydroxylase